METVAETPLLAGEEMFAAIGRKIAVSDAPLVVYARDKIAKGNEHLVTAYGRYLADGKHKDRVLKVHNWLGRLRERISLGEIWNDLKSFHVGLGMKSAAFKDALADLELFEKAGFPIIETVLHRNAVVEKNNYVDHESTREGRVRDGTAVL